MGRGGNRCDSLVVSGLRPILQRKGRTMDGQRRAEKSPRDVRREFVGCRLESQRLIRAYELAVPVVRRRIVVSVSPSVGVEAERFDRIGLMAQGA